ncbi:52 kDa repressor of the inhibitor of the protein kinase-like [Scleropages formosus]|uniref:52 kDa repressor of the inhibitor of the protein kinase-like n=1 Tax=Scleropages formosus TaxID=113540 RepID=A0A0P7WQ50_SCLFO|nr:52 kDa repressor of the inhibitor of the protein kinase-like [Scleropages formosus]
MKVISQPDYLRDAQFLCSPELLEEEHGARPGILQVPSRCRAVSDDSPFRTMLKDNAVPTIFDLTSHLSNPDSRHRKRIKELTEEELEKMKERRLETSSGNVTNDDTGQDISDTSDDLPPLTEKEKEERDYLKALFEILVVLGKQNIPLHGHTEEKTVMNFTPSNFQSLLEYRINAGDEILRKRFEAMAVNAEYCSSSQQRQMLEVCESCIREQLLQEVRECRFFSLLTDDLVDMAGEAHLPMFLRFADQSHCLREEFVGFLPFEGDEDTLTERLLCEITENWGLNMEYCRGQAHVGSGVFTSRIKAIAAKLLAKYPMAVYTPFSSRALNISLASTLNLKGVQIVMSTLKRISSFFSTSPALQAELEHAISIFYQGNEKKGDDLKETSRTSWAEGQDCFDLAVELLESVLLCMDSVHDNEDLRWNDQVVQEAYMISQTLADFQFVVTLVVLKNTLSFTRAFGKNLQGQLMDVYFAANSLTAVLHSLNEVMDNIEVYHEFWFEEAVNLAAALEIPVKIPRLFYRKQRSGTWMDIEPECYYKESLTIPVVAHVIQELNDAFSENHLKALKCLSLVPSVMGELKFNTSEEHDADIFKNDLANPDTLSTELHCWRIKWKHRGKEISLPSTISETLQLSEVKFFPNVYALLKVLSTLTVLTLEDTKSNSVRKRFKAYVTNTHVSNRAKSLAFLNINYDVKHDLDLMVDTYTKMYPEKENE